MQGVRASTTGLSSWYAGGDFGARIFDDDVVVVVVAVMVVAVLLHQVLLPSILLFLGRYG
jgi:hypothetical protein